MRKLKEYGTSETELKPAIEELLRRKQELSVKYSESAHDVSFVAIFFQLLLIFIF